MSANVVPPIKKKTARLVAARLLKPHFDKVDPNLKDAFVEMLKQALKEHNDSAISSQSSNMINLNQARKKKLHDDQDNQIIKITLQHICRTWSSGSLVDPRLLLWAQQQQITPPVTTIQPNANTTRSIRGESSSSNSNAFSADAHDSESVVVNPSSATNLELDYASLYIDWLAFPESRGGKNESDYNILANRMILDALDLPMQKRTLDFFKKSDRKLYLQRKCKEDPRELAFNAFKALSRLQQTKNETKKGRYAANEKNLLARLEGYAYAVQCEKAHISSEEMGERADSKHDEEIKDSGVIILPQRSHVVVNMLNAIAAIKKSRKNKKIIRELESWCLKFLKKEASIPELFDLYHTKVFDVKEQIEAVAKYWAFYTWPEYEEVDLSTGWLPNFLSAKGQRETLENFFDEQIASRRRQEFPSKQPNDLLTTNINSLEKSLAIDFFPKIEKKKKSLSDMKGYQSTWEKLVARLTNMKSKLPASSTVTTSTANLFKNVHKHIKIKRKEKRKQTQAFQLNKMQLTSIAKIDKINENPVFEFVIQLLDFAEKNAKKKKFVSGKIDEKVDDIVDLCRGIFNAATQNDQTLAQRALIKKLYESVTELEKPKKKNQYAAQLYQLVKKELTRQQQQNLLYLNNLLLQQDNQNDYLQLLAVKNEADFFQLYGIDLLEHVAFIGRKYYERNTHSFKSDELMGSYIAHVSKLKEKADLKKYAAAVETVRKIDAAITANINTADISIATLAKHPVFEVLYFYKGKEDKEFILNQVIKKLADLNEELLIPLKNQFIPAFLLWVNTALPERAKDAISSIEELIIIQINAFVISVDSGQSFQFFVDDLSNDPWLKLRRQQNTAFDSNIQTIINNKVADFKKKTLGFIQDYQILACNSEGARSYNDQNFQVFVNKLLDNPGVQLYLDAEFACEIQVAIEEKTKEYIQAYQKLLHDKHGRIVKDNIGVYDYLMEIAINGKLFNFRIKNKDYSFPAPTNMLTTAIFGKVIADYIAINTQLTGINGFTDFFDFIKMFEQQRQQVGSLCRKIVINNVTELNVEKIAERYITLLLDEAVKNHNITSELTCLLNDPAGLVLKFNGKDYLAREIVHKYLKEKLPTFSLETFVVTRDVLEKLNLVEQLSQEIEICAKKCAEKGMVDKNWAWMEKLNEDRYIFTVGEQQFGSGYVKDVISPILATRKFLTVARNFLNGNIENEQEFFVAARDFLNGHSGTAKETSIETSLELSKNLNLDEIATRIRDLLTGEDKIFYEDPVVWDAFSYDVHAIYQKLEKLLHRTKDKFVNFAVSAQAEISKERLQFARALHIIAPVSRVSPGKSSNREKKGETSKPHKEKSVVFKKKKGNKQESEVSRTCSRNVSNEDVLISPIIKEGHVYLEITAKSLQRYQLHLNKVQKKEYLNELNVVIAEKQLKEGHPYIDFVINIGVLLEPEKNIFDHALNEKDYADIESMLKNYTPIALFQSYLVQAMGKKDFTHFEKDEFINLLKPLKTDPFVQALVDELINIGGFDCQKLLSEIGTQAQQDKAVSEKIEKIKQNSRNLIIFFRKEFSMIHDEWVKKENSGEIGNLLALPANMYEDYYPLDKAILLKEGVQLKNNLTWARETIEELLSQLVAKIESEEYLVDMSKANEALKKNINSSRDAYARISRNGQDFRYSLHADPDNLSRNLARAKQDSREEEILWWRYIGAYVELYSEIKTESLQRSIKGLLPPQKIEKLKEIKDQLYKATTDRCDPKLRAYTYIPAMNRQIYDLGNTANPFKEFHLLDEFAICLRAISTFSSNIESDEDIGKRQTDEALLIDQVNTSRNSHIEKMVTYVKEYIDSNFNFESMLVVPGKEHTNSINDTKNILSFFYKTMFDKKGNLTQEASYFIEYVYVIRAYGTLEAISALSTQLSTLHFNKVFEDFPTLFSGLVAVAKSALNKETYIIDRKKKEGLRKKRVEAINKIQNTLASILPSDKSKNIFAAEGIIFTNSSIRKFAACMHQADDEKLLDCIKKDDKQNNNNNTELYLVISNLSKTFFGVFASPAAREVMEDRYPEESSEEIVESNVQEKARPRSNFGHKDSLFPMPSSSTPASPLPLPVSDERQTQSATLQHT